MFFFFFYGMQFSRWHLKKLCKLLTFYLRGIKKKRFAVKVFIFQRKWHSYKMLLLWKEMLSVALPFIQSRKILQTNNDKKKKNVFSDLQWCVIPSNNITLLMDRTGGVYPKIMYLSHRKSQTILHSLWNCHSNCQNLLLVYSTNCLILKTSTIWHLNEVTTTLKLLASIFTTSLELQS